MRRRRRPGSSPHRRCPRRAGSCDGPRRPVRDGVRSMTHQGEGTVKTTACAAQRLGEVIVDLKQRRREQVRDDLGVGLGRQVTPAAVSSLRSSAKFSMMPLWMTATWPLLTDMRMSVAIGGSAMVAHRVWPIPVVESGHRDPSRAASRGWPVAGLLAADDELAPDGDPPDGSRDCGTGLDHDLECLLLTDVSDDSAHRAKPTGASSPREAMEHAGCTAAVRLSLPARACSRPGGDGGLRGGIVADGASGRDNVAGHHRARGLPGRPHGCESSTCSAEPSTRPRRARRRAALIPSATSSRPTCPERG